MCGVKLVREFLHDEDDPGHNVNAGRLPEEARKRIETWADGTGWVEEDQARLIPAEQGWLWIHQTDGT